MKQPHEGIVVTGAAGYLGSALVKYFASSGRPVFATSRSTPKPWEVSNVCDLSGVDLLKIEDLHRLKTAIQSWANGRFHIINTVGYFPGYISLCDLSSSDFTRTVHENLTVLHAAAKIFIPIQKSNGGGHFIAFSSHSVENGYPLMSAFTAAKAAVGSLIQTIANEHSHDRIVATALAVATIDTPKERRIRPYADPKDWLRVEQLCDFIEHLISGPFDIMNGNTVHLFNYSPTFFHKAYFDRLGIDPDV